MSRWTRNRGGASGDDEPTAGRETAGGRRRRENAAAPATTSVRCSPHHRPAGTPESDRPARTTLRRPLRPRPQPHHRARADGTDERRRRASPTAIAPTRWSRRRSPTQAIPTARSRFRPARSNHRPAPPRPEQHRPEPTRPEPPRPDAPTTALPPIPRVEGSGVTQKIPPVGADGPGPDLSDRATTRRAIEESRAQGGQPVPGPVAPGDRRRRILRRNPRTPPPTTRPPRPSPRLPQPPPTTTPSHRSPRLRPQHPTRSPLPAWSARRILTKVARSRPRRLAGRFFKQSLSRNATMTGRILVSVACIHEAWSTRMKSTRSADGVRRPRRDEPERRQHPRQERPVRRRELPDRHRHPQRPERRRRRRHHRRRRGRPLSFP